MSIALSPNVKQSLAAFMESRNLKARAISALGSILQSKNLKKGELTQSQNSSYATIIDEFDKALSNNWMTSDELVAILDEAEIAGRQHVCVYRLPEEKPKRVLNALRAPTGVSSAAPALEDFYTMPAASYARVLHNEADKIMIKIVTRRRYWRAEVDPTFTTATEEWVHRWLQEERAAVILKCVPSTKLLQIRVPPREHLSVAETGKTVYEFATKTLADHYDLSKWINLLGTFPITDAYNAILANRTDFVLRHDSPESDTAKSRLSKKGSLKDLKDLRDDPMWDFEKGYARKTLRGSWVVDKKPVYTHLNYDSLRFNKKTTHDYARVFFPQMATDAEVDHVLARVISHV